MKRALIVVDVQKDFCSGGALAVPNGDGVVLVINEIKPHFDNVYYTVDWHPADHCSFKENGGDWPAHCVQGTDGAAFHRELDTAIDVDDVLMVIHKGEDSNVDSYSGFYDNERKSKTELLDELREEGVTDVYVCGLALDYCVKFTALDAASEGFNTFVIFDACRAVNAEENAVLQTIAEFFTNGVTIIESLEITALTRSDDVSQDKKEFQRKRKQRRENRQKKHKE